MHNSMTRRSVLGLGFSSLAASLAIPSEISHAAQPQAAKGHSHLSPELIEYQLQIRSIVKDLKDDHRPDEALRKASALIRLRAAHLESTGTVALIQQLAKDSIRSRGRKATLLLDPNLSEVDAHVKAVGGDFFPEIPQMNRYVKANYAAREKFMDDILKGGYADHLRHIADMFDTESKVLQAKIEAGGVRRINQFVCTVYVDQFICEWPCQAPCGGAEYLKSAADWICGIVAFCVIVTLGACEEMASVCAAAQAEWFLAATACEICKAYYGG